MKALLLSMIMVCLATAEVTAKAEEDDPIESARAFFETYVELEHAFDPALAGLYSDDAVIKNTRRYPTGQVRVLELPGARYKTLIREAMPLAKERGDKSTFSEVTIDLNESGSVTIRASRYSQLKDYTSPIEITVLPNGDGDWLIVKEESESQP